MKKKIVYVVWNDASHDSRTQTAAEFDRDCITITAGVFAGKTKEHLSVASDYWHADRRYRHTTHIPVGMIRELHIVKIPKKKNA